jgi:REP element-mobilizing transposase RayT
MAFAYPIKDQGAIYFVTFTVHQWVDVFTRPTYRDILFENLCYCQASKGLNIYAWGLMSNHIHLIVSATNENLSDIIIPMLFVSQTKYTVVHTDDIAVQANLLVCYRNTIGIRDFKKYTSKKIVQAINENPKESRKEWLLLTLKVGKDIWFWEEGYHGIEIRDMSMFESKLNYIHLNPVRNGLVEKAEDYLLSSANDYLGIKKGI